MKLKNLVVYLLIFIVLGVFYYVYEVRIGGLEKEAQEAELKIYPAVRLAQVDEVKLTARGQTVRLVRTEPDRWRLVEPIETPADRWEIEGLVRQVLDGEKDREFEKPVGNLAEFGLDRPEISLSLYGGGRLLGPSLHLGALNPLGFLSYALLGDSTRVFTVTQDVRQALDRSLYDLRDKSLVLLGGEKMDYLVLEAKDKVELKRRGIRSWDITEPRPGSADADVVQRLIYRGLKGKVQEFLAGGGEPPAPAGPGEETGGDPYGFDRPFLKVRVMSEGRVAADLVMGGPKLAPSREDPANPVVQGFWIRSTERPEIMLLGLEEAAALRLNLEDLIDRHVLALNSARVDKILITRGPRRMRIEKIKEVWDVLEPGTPLSQHADVESFLSHLENLKWVRQEGAEKETVEKWGLHQPDMMITLECSEESQRLAVSLQPVEEQYLAARAGEGPVVLIDRAGFLNALPEEIRPEAPEPAADQKGGNE
ncbi:MAG: DUF4340 domain-containing protein [Thermodesulfobacteriota bacterium]